MRSIVTLFLIVLFPSFLLANQHGNIAISKDGNASFQNASEPAYRNQSILSSGKWVRVSTEKSGILKISYSKLSEMGISSPTNIAVYSNGGYMLPKMNAVFYPDDLTRLPVIHSKDKSGVDCIFFYCPGTTKWIYNNDNQYFYHNTNLYSDSTFFYLSSDVTPSPVPTSSAPITESPDTVLNDYIALDVYEKENINLVGSGRFWYSDILLDGLRKTYNFSFPNAITSRNATITLTTAGRCTSASPSTNVKINNSTAYTIDYSKSSSLEYFDWADTSKNIWYVPLKENTTIDLTYNTKGESGNLWVDYIAFNVPSSLTFTGSQLNFRTNAGLHHNFIEYKIQEATSNSILWNITNPLEPKRIDPNYKPDSKELSFVGIGGTIEEFILFDPLKGTFPEPHFSSKITNQNIHGLPSYEMIIVTHPDFINEASKLAEFHRQFDNMGVLIVTTNEVYNEFSSGMPDISAIRNMFRMFYYKYRNSATPFKYALFMGDGSYNNRSIDKTKNNNYIPTYQSVNSINKGDSYVTDDFYGLLEENEGESFGTLDIGIGRIPCKTASEADDVISKIIDYTKPKTLGDWRNNVCFIADDEDLNQYMTNSERLDELLTNNYPGFFTKKIYFDSYQQISTSGGFKYPEATVAINQAVNDGALILNYIGHGNPQSMAHENVLLINDIKSWKNSNALPLFVTATCEFGRFDAEATSAAEEILLNPTGGGIALFTTTRPVFAGNNQTLSINFFSNIFKHDSTGEKLRLGDVMKNAKNLTKDTNKLSFSLLADPALRLAFPKYSVHTKTINGINIDTTEITLGALEKVTIKGEVVDYNNEVLRNYTGTVTTVIYDKKQTVETLANDGGSIFSFQVQNNAIYRGSASVINGEFELTFIVPKDISYNTGSGKIIYYTSNGENDGNGAITNFNIGGSSANPVIDNNSPEIEMFMNNEDFKSGDKVSSSALLLVNLFDESGINTVGTGIGHDLIAVLDSNYSNQIVLNGFYSSISDSYQRGKIIYPLTGLEPGKHTLWIRVWDVQNNSSEKEITFYVEDGFKVTSVNTLPNPVSSYTDFEISHNLPGEVFDVTIDIYNLAGKKVNAITESVSSSKTTKIKVRWNVFDSSYPVYPNQWLVYQVILKNQSGLTANGAGKILISPKN